MMVRCLMVVAVLAGSVAARAAQVAAQAQVAPADGPLTAKGLVKSGYWYLLETDARLPEGLKKIRQAQRTIEGNARKRSAIQAEIKRAEDVLLANLNERTRLQSVRRESMGVDAYNQNVSQSNACLVRAKEAETYAERKREELKKIVDPSDDYITNVIDLSDRMEEAAKQYEALAKDPEVLATIAAINKTAKPPVKLGPSAQFAQELKPMRVLRKSVESSSIPLRMDGASPMVDVIVNGGGSAVEMVLDSGANSVVISHETAAKLGLKPPANAQVVTATVAGGGKVQTRLMTLKSVRVGQFTAENVECLIMPPGAGGKSHDLLGVSFLQHFVYRIDLAGGVLHLQQVGGKPAARAAGPAATSKPSAATSKPAAATAKPADAPAKPADASAKAVEATIAPAAGRVVKLLSSGFDLKTDVVSGNWTQSADGIASDAAPASRVRLRYKPPQEYDFIIEFTRKSGDDTVVQSFSVGDRTVQWVLGGYYNTVCAFELIDGQEGSNNVTTVKRSIESNKRINSTVRVRKDSITAYIDGEQVAQYKGDLTALSTPEKWSLGSDATLGVGCWNSPTVFHMVRVVEVK